jgi:hypothetical protein
VFDASTSTNIRKVLGNSGDSVNALGFAKISGVETEGSITYDVILIVVPTPMLMLRFGFNKILIWLLCKKGIEPVALVLCIDV